MGPVCRATASSSQVSTLYGGSPATISNSSTPSPYRSVAGSAGLPSRRSGAAYAGVPKVAPVSSSSGSPAAALIPKSSSFTPPLQSITLPGLMSRCTTPAACAAASAPATAAPTAAAAGHGIGPSQSRAATVSPASSSITTNGTTEPSGRTASR
ncbi:MAP/microtubule affinity-regulating kinase 3 [Actinoplanes sp. SE50/110]|nr:MAP/microtubule affinity-regulating kinase 3 [Actinoplanes sp. SE50/110]